MRLMMIFAFLLLTGCGYTMALGKKCTPGHDEWSYVWFIEKEGTHNIKKVTVRRNNVEEKL